MDEEAIIKNFIEEQESIGNSLINTRRCAMDRTDEWFKKEYEDQFEWDELYEASEKHPETGKVLCWSLREFYSDLYWDKMDTFEEELLEYKNDEYEAS